LAIFSKNISGHTAAKAGSTFAAIFRSFLKSNVFRVPDQDCQMAYFQENNPILCMHIGERQCDNAGIFYGDLEYFTANWFFDGHLGKFVVI
jgi:hypothetical protein